VRDSDAGVGEASSCCCCGDVAAAVADAGAGEGADAVAVEVPSTEDGVFFFFFFVLERGETTSSTSSACSRVWDCGAWSSEAAAAVAGGVGRVSGVATVLPEGAARRRGFCPADTVLSLLPSLLCDSSPACVSMMGAIAPGFEVVALDCLSFVLFSFPSPAV